VGGRRNELATATLGPARPFDQFANRRINTVRSNSQELCKVKTNRQVRQVSNSKLPLDSPSTSGFYLANLAFLEVQKSTLLFSWPISGAAMPLFSDRPDHPSRFPNSSEPVKIS
jgi:hypothetical protein